VVNNSQCERLGKRDLSDLEGEQIVGARLAGASVTKIVTLLGVSRATIYRVMSAYEYTNHEKTSAKRNCEQKSTLTERDRRTLRRIISKNHITTAAQVTAELSIHIEECFHKNCPT
jgi:transposase